MYVLLNVHKYYIWRVFLVKLNFPVETHTVYEINFDRVIRFCYKEKSYSKVVQLKVFSFSGYDENSKIYVLLWRLKANLQKTIKWKQQ